VELADRMKKWPPVVSVESDDLIKMAICGICGMVSVELADIKKWPPYLFLWNHNCEIRRSYKKVPTFISVL